MMYFRIQYALYALLYLVFTVYTAPTFAKIIYKVDRAIDAADLIVLGEIYKVEMVDHAGSPIWRKKLLQQKKTNIKLRITSE